MKIDRIDTLLSTADLGTKFLDAARRKQLVGMLPLREARRTGTAHGIHERRLERMVDGRRTEDA